MSTRNDVLDAARRCLVRGSGRKLTLAEVAREAGVSRPTVYRRWPEVSAVIRDLLTRDMTSLVTEHITAVDAAIDSAPESSPPEVLAALVDGIVGAAIALSEDTLFSSLLRRQPDLMAPYVFQRLGASQRGVLALLDSRITQAQQVGAVRSGDPMRLGAMVLLITQSAIQSRSVVAPVLGGDWSQELTRALCGYLTPVEPVSVPTTTADTPTGDGDRDEERS
ncbi:TetR/AcrR family transcriptional regulator [Williamsia sp. Leaf354]|uniref:TetR/AcrR family transcriptional regulator n=1 Tax=Williamsia sp. Leaf354 TaxID=1736349 RepID=UPI0009E809A8|nr:TetR/AcrR family transcriptional regulator [Williamsia sp. Leaf354]